MRVLALFAGVSAFGAEERARVVMTERRGQVLIEDLFFRNCFKEYDSAYRVCPVQPKGAPAIFYVHWLETSHSTSNRSAIFG